jgi:hypothetical protein
MGVTHSQTTNSWIGRSDGKWERERHWDDGLPSITQSAVIISNANSKVVTIDKHTARKFPDSLTISNLTVSAQGGDTNTLFLENTGTVALHILNDLTIGIGLNNFGDPFTREGALISTNSTLIVDGLLDGQLEDNGTIVITGGSLITTNCSLQVAVPTDNPAVGLLIISNTIVQARDVTVAASYSESSGTMEVISGIMTLSSSLTVGNSDGRGDGGYGSLLVANGCMLVVTNEDTGIINGTMTVANASFLGAGVFLGGGKSFGELAINNGTVTLSGGIEVALGDRSSGNVSLNGGMLIVTNNAINMGAVPGVGNFAVSDGIFLGQAMFLLESTLSIQGGTSILSSNLVLYFGSAFYINGGQLFVTNAPIIIRSGRASIVSGGLLAANYIDFADGQLLINGGSVTVSTGITLGNCDGTAVGYASVDGGQLTVTNAAHTGFIDVRSGEVTLDGGTLQVDKLVMTNSCGSFIHTGGTLIVGSVVLDPNAFRITSVAREGNNLRVTWLMGPGQTNALQVSSGGIHGSYNTNSFTDIFVVTNNTFPGTLTNYLDIGAATNKPSRFYRARLAP